ncbi:MAG: protein-disulfide reductase DsbD family protein [Phycisphaerales bacterium]
MHLALFAAILAAAALTQTPPDGAPGAAPGGAPDDAKPAASGAGARAPGLSEGIDRAKFRWGQATDGSWVLVASFDITPGWHTYWMNPGDSGDAPSFELTVPEGWQVGETIYPRPDVKLMDGAPFYGYEGRAHYLIPVRRVGDAGDTGWNNPGGSAGSGGKWKISARIMACRSRCTMSKASAEGTWPPSPEAGTDINLNGGSFDGRSLPATAAKAGLFARLETGKVRIEGSARGHASASFVPAAVPGMQLTLPSDAAAVAGTVDGDKFKIACALESPGAGPRTPAFAGLVLLGRSPGDPCVWITIPHPLAGPEAAPGANGVGASDGAPPSKGG